MSVEADDLAMGYCKLATLQRLLGELAEEQPNS